MMEYKGYTARVEFDQDARILFGEVEGLRDVVTFEASDAKDLEREFHASVDDYLAMCAERGEEPDKPYSGKFLIRVDPMLHREIAMAAARAGTSLNALTVDVLRSWVEHAREASATPRVPAPNVNRPAKQVSVFEAKAEAVEAQTREKAPDLWQGAPQNTPGSRTPNTPAGSRTPQHEVLDPAA